MDIDYKLKKEKFIINAKNKGYFILDGNKINYLDIGKKRAEFYFDLLEKYKYQMNIIEFDVDNVDIIIYTDASKKKAYIIIEFEKTVKQTIAKARKLKACYAVCIVKNIRKIIKIDNNSIISDLPIAYGK